MHFLLHVNCSPVPHKIPVTAGWTRLLMILFRPAVTTEYFVWNWETIHEEGNAYTEQFDHIHRTQKQTEKQTQNIFF